MFDINVVSQMIDSFRLFTSHRWFDHRAICYCRPSSVARQVKEGRQTYTLIIQHD